MTIPFHSIETRLILFSSCVANSLIVVAFLIMSACLSLLEASIALVNAKQYRSPAFFGTASFHLSPFWVLIPTRDLTLLLSKGISLSTYFILFREQVYVHSSNKFIHEFIIFAVEILWKFFEEI